MVYMFETLLAFRIVYSVSAISATRGSGNAPPTPANSRQTMHWPWPWATAWKVSLPAGEMATVVIVAVWNTFVMNSRTDLLASLQWHNAQNIAQPS